MRIIFLNAWHAGVKDKLFGFISKEATDTDIFCLLEVTTEMFPDLSEILSDFKGEYIENSSTSGQTVFVRKNINIIFQEKIEIRKQEPGDTGCLQKVKINFNNSNLVIGCVHGKAQPGTKLDTDMRIKQSEIILKAFENEDLPQVIGGDFNLMPDTESIKMFESAGYKNLIKDFNIQETRNHLSWEQFPENPKQHFADYCFVSPDIKVINFEVPNVEVSDHLPLILDFEL